MKLESMVAHTSNSSTWEVKVGILGVQGHYWLYSEFETSLQSMRFFKRKHHFVCITEEILA